MSGKTIKVVRPAVLRDRCREIAGSVLAGRPTYEQKKETNARILVGVGGLFPREQKGGRTVSTHRTYGELARDTHFKTIQWNAELLLGYVFGDEDKPFRALPFGELTDGQWVALGRWAGVIGDVPQRPGFGLECVWLSNRGLWSWVYNQRFYSRVPFSQVLREMERAYDADAAGILIEKEGQLATGLQMQGEPVAVTDENFMAMLARWRQIGAVEPAE